MFKIKICGITTPEDALLAVDAGADAIGLNFYEKSPRYVTPESGGEIARLIFAVEPNLNPTRVVGVFVNSTPDRTAEIELITGVRDCQFHGDEPAATIAAWSRMSRIFDQIIPQELSIESLLEAIKRESQSWTSPTQHSLVIRAFRPKSASLVSDCEYLRECEAAGGLPDAVLLDAHAPGSYGGTGVSVDWNMIRDQRDKLLGLPLILAGGLTPDNVAQAILTAHPDAVDVASGVESSPGKKDPAKVRDFVAAAKEAFATLARSASEG